jgi:hypothetical protein
MEPHGDVSRQRLPDAATFADVGLFMRALVRERVGVLFGAVRGQQRKGE